MKAIRAFLCLALAPVFTACCTGDRAYFESAYYTFIKDTPHDIQIECIDRREELLGDGYYVAAGEEFTFFAGAFR